MVKHKISGSENLIKTQNWSSSIANSRIFENLEDGEEFGVEYTTLLEKQSEDPLHYLKHLSEYFKVYDLDFNALNYTISAKILKISIKPSLNDEIMNQHISEFDKKYSDMVYGKYIPRLYKLTILPDGVISRLKASIFKNKAEADLIDELRVYSKVIIDQDPKLRFHYDCFLNPFLKLFKHFGNQVDKFLLKENLSIITVTKLLEVYKKLKWDEIFPNQINLLKLVANKANFDISEMAMFYDERDDMVYFVFKYDDRYEAKQVFNDTLQIFEAALKIQEGKLGGHTFSWFERLWNEVKIEKCTISFRNLEEILETIKQTF